MKRCIYTLAFFCMLCFGWMLNPLTVHAEIASDRAFDGAVWEKIIEDDIEAAEGVVQSMCVTDYYIIMMGECCRGWNDTGCYKSILPV